MVFSSTTKSSLIASLESKQPFATGADLRSWAQEHGGTSWRGQFSPQMALCPRNRPSLRCFIWETGRRAFVWDKDASMSISTTRRSRWMPPAAVDVVLVCLVEFCQPPRPHQLAADPTSLRRHPLHLTRRPWT